LQENRRQEIELERSGNELMRKIIDEKMAQKMKPIEEKISKIFQFEFDSGDFFTLDGRSNEQHSGDDVDISYVNYNDEYYSNDDLDHGDDDQSDDLNQKFAQNLNNPLNYILSQNEQKELLTRDEKFHLTMTSYLNDLNTLQRKHQVVLDELYEELEDVNKDNLLNYQLLLEKIAFQNFDIFSEKIRTDKDGKTKKYTRDDLYQYYLYLNELNNNNEYLNQITEQSRYRRKNRPAQRLKNEHNGQHSDDKLRFDQYEDLNNNQTHKLPKKGPKIEQNPITGISNPNPADNSSSSDSDLDLMDTRHRRERRRERKLRKDKRQLQNKNFSELKTKKTVPC